METQVVGLDFAEVIAKRHLRRWKIPQRFHQWCPEVTGAIQSIRRIVEAVGAENVYIITGSQNSLTDFKRWQWLHRTRFFEKTGMLPQNFIICRNRSDKTALCRQYGITVMIDDRFQILRELDANVRLIAFHPNPTEMAKFPDLTGRVEIASTWTHVLNLLGI